MHFIVRRIYSPHYVHMKKKKKTILITYMNLKVLGGGVNAASWGLEPW